MQKRNRVLVLSGEDGAPGTPLVDYLGSARETEVQTRPAGPLPGDLDAFDVLVLADPGRWSDQEFDRLVAYVRAGGACLGFLPPSVAPPPSLFGARLAPQGPRTELRVSFADPGSSMASRLPEEIFLHSRYQPLESTNGDATPLLLTMWHYREAWLALERREGEGRVCCTTIDAYDDPLFHQIVHRMVRHLGGLDEERTVGAAVIGYGPSGSVGHLHGMAFQAVGGLELRAVCDRDPLRLEEARHDFAGVRTYQSVEELGRDATVELVVVATPPNTHALLATKLLRAGKHVVSEKPLCITHAEAESLIRAAEEADRVVSCYQNRRWDVDFRAIQRAVRAGLIGDPFHLETFVGGYNHPCDFWHSHEPISGGALYDWGAHYVDWMLNLFPGPTESVSGASHKRVWHDVTNADQVRAHIRFAGGQESDFIHSDIAAARKPKWFLLGTEGAIVGHWNDVTMLESDPYVHFRESQVPSTETAPFLTLTRQVHGGGVEEQQLPLPEQTRHPYHRNLADHLLTGEPLAVTAASSARVVAVLEAASRSAQRGGAPEPLRV